MKNRPLFLEILKKTGMSAARSARRAALVGGVAGRLLNS